MTDRSLEGKFGWVEGNHQHFDECWHFSSDSHYPFDTREQAIANAKSCTDDAISVFQLKWTQINPSDCVPDTDRLSELFNEVFEDRHTGLNANDELEFTVDIAELESMIENWVNENVKTTSRMMAHFSESAFAIGGP